MVISVICCYYIKENQHPWQSCELCTTMILATGAQSVCVLSKVSEKPHLGWQRKVSDGFGTSDLGVLGIKT